ncbi:MAG TPA: glycosyltransferase, partial [Candidatus Thermoplasmatota archaeon]|nr:glycosyltransferase [Candidatus Thermoplasmatota archaeon]
RDRYVIMVADDSTRPELREPLERYCAERGLWYHHREDRRGFKAGALNEALAATPDDADLIAVIDADYQIEPTYLQETVGHFVNPRLGFLQTPQDYRNLQQSFLARQYYVADAYFYRAVLPSRNEGNAIIFCGTMGIIRRTALEQVGGWGEGYITEDAELSARILRAKWESLYVNKTYGRGLMPATFDGYKKQLHRWAFGGVQILKGHAGDLFRRGLTSRQKLDFLVGGIHWFDGVYIVIIALALATMGIADLLGRQVVTHHARELGLVALIPIFLLVDGLARLHLALKPSLRLPLGATFGVMGMWYATKFNNAHAALKALIGIKMPFVRTPKAPTQRVGAREALGLALKLTRFETFMSIAMLGISLAVVGKTLALWAGTGSVAPARVFLAGWLGYHSLLFATAPIYAYRSYVTFAPDEEPPAEPAAAATFTGFDEREPPARSPLPPSSRPANLTQVPGQPRL